MVKWSESGVFLVKEVWVSDRVWFTHTPQDATVKGCRWIYGAPFVFLVSTMNFESWLFIVSGLAHCRKSSGTGSSGWMAFLVDFQASKLLIADWVFLEVFCGISPFENSASVLADENSKRDWGRGWRSPWPKLEDRETSYCQKTNFCSSFFTFACMVSHRMHWRAR